MSKQAKTKQMDFTLIENRIKHAIESRTTMLVVLKYSGGMELEAELNPYIFGEDIMQYEFVWGFLPHSGNFYKLELDKIISVKNTIKRFSIEPEAVYLYALEERHTAVVAPWDRIFAGGIPPEIKL